uniref:UBA domain-containing protein n=1 Tax=Picea sitchensis TaxID=3332 RepID=A9NVQ2_PICSI|nr:unknown [Picea sitchensis]
MNNGPAGFQNAPVTKGLIITSAIFSIVIGMQHGASACSLSYQGIVRKLHLWRLVTSAFVFSSTPELMFGLCLLYYFRVFERQIGSNKYSVFVLFSVIFTTFFELISLVVFKVSTWFRIFGIQFSDKSFVYLAGLQLLISSRKRSFIPGICGIIAGLSYRLNVFGIRRIKFPEQIASAVSRFSLPTMLMGLSSTSSRENVTREAVTSYDTEFEDEFAAATPLLRVTIDPSEEAVSTLVAMGFDRNLAIEALAQADNDISAATNLLLETQSH